MPKLRRALKIGLFNLALFLVLVELVALGAYFFETRELYYLHKPAGRQAALELESSVETFQIHPYYGYTLRPTSAPTTSLLASGHSEDVAIHANNFGFESAVDYPVERERPERFLVGLFGGSVAAKLATFEAHEGILAQKLAAALGRRAEDVEILNFAQGGFKQPQQLLVLGHLLAIGQELDLVLELDGFNDVALAGINLRSGIAPGMPSIDHVRALQDVTSIAESPEAVEKLLGIRRHWARYARTFNRAWGGEAWELRFASGFLVDWIVYKFHLRRYHESRLEYAESAAEGGQASWLYLEREENGPAEAETPEAMVGIVEQWARSARLMRKLQRAAGGCYLHFVQPNQYFETGRAFSEAEREVAFARRSGYAPFVRRGYPLLEAEVARLEAEGFPIWGLFHLFDDVSEPVYIDDCCHFTDPGQKILAERIGEIAAQNLEGCAQGP